MVQFFWTEEQIKLRETFKDHIFLSLKNVLKQRNKSFDFIQIEAPLITPVDFINKNYTQDDMYFLDEKFALRPETTMGSFEALKVFIDPNRKISKLPLVVYQHGKSFRKEQDQPTKFMRLKEFYQLEFQIAYAENTLDDYSKIVIPAVTNTIASFIGACKTENSDRLPDYSEETIDIICEKSNMEVCSISKRKDFPGAKILEVAIGTDRLIYNFINKQL